MGILQKYQLSIYFIISVAVIICNILCSQNLRAKTLYFIHSGPTEITATPRVPFETRIYSFDEENGELRQVWTLGKDKEAGKIAVYPNPGIVLIGGDRNKPNEIYIFTMNEIGKPKVIRLGEADYIGDFRYYQRRDKDDRIEIEYFDNSDGHSYSRKRASYSPEGIYAPDSVRDSDSAGEIRLCGGRPIGCNESDIISVLGLPKGKIRGNGFDSEQKTIPMPDSIMQLSASNGWSLIANEPDFNALVSRSAEISDRIWTRVSIFNRLIGKWTSILIRGESESLRLVNDWLVGEINDYKQTAGEGELPEPLEGELTVGDAVLINPVENCMLTTYLGIGGLILWVENNTVYYKTVDGENAYLYRAKIEDSGLVNKELLSTDSVVRFFRWGFRGSSE